MAPTLQHDSTVEWLAFGSHDDTVIFAPCVGVVFAPAHLKAFKIQFIESNQQVFRPLVAVTPFPQAVINEEIIENWRTKHPVFPPKLAYSDEGAVSHQFCFVAIYSR